MNYIMPTSKSFDLCRIDENKYVIYKWVVLKFSCGLGIFNLRVLEEFGVIDV